MINFDLVLILNQRLSESEKNTLKNGNEDIGETLKSMQLKLDNSHK